MTLTIAVASPKGFVLAADGRSIRRTRRRWEIQSDTARKVFQCGSVGIATYGVASIGNDRVSRLVSSVAGRLSGQPPSEIAAALANSFEERLVSRYGNSLPRGKGYALGFLVAGYEADAEGVVLEVGLPGAEITEQLRTDDDGFAIRGQTDVIERLIYGFDKLRLESADLTIPDDLWKALDNLEYEPCWPETRQEAAKLAEFLVSTTISTHRFTRGTRTDAAGSPPTGGRQQMLEVGPGGSRWLSGAP